MSVKKQKKRRGSARLLVVGLLVLILVGLGARLAVDRSHGPKAQAPAGQESFRSGETKSKGKQQQYIQEPIPTFFFHGWNGSYRSEEQMCRAIKAAGVTKTVIRADVDERGGVSFVGTIPKGASNPLVEVNFVDNKNVDYTTLAAWARNVIVATRGIYRFDSYNAVGHSMGNMVIMNFLNNYSDDATLPLLHKQVALAGNFNGIIGDDDQPNLRKLDAEGKPNQMNWLYQNILPLRQTYPQGVDVLNIYGNIGDGTNSDGNLTNASSQSMRYLVSGRAKSYREEMISGKNGGHSALHENQEVDRLLIDFLW
ncbi:alpha/beta hydrolase [Bifidobacterium aemilianum]|uniref:Alpha/beta hydrolase n=1 Tax=Bifidobacterium aemilianum TaxID=2493120 RepID=A0A366K7Y2_9BIFI|nr:alpha/beta hydrolase [Bifidobacterium aemilianum]RBP97774.1 alpha/beta hydrolase [Bifidobacterium aemilianum]